MGAMIEFLGCQKSEYYRLKPWSDKHGLFAFINGFADEPGLTHVNAILSPFEIGYFLKLCGADHFFEVRIVPASF